MIQKMKKAASLLLVISVLMSLLSVAASAVDTVTLIQKDNRGQEDTTVVYTAEGEWNCLVFKQATGAVVWTAEPVEDETSLWAALQAEDPSLANSVDQYAFTTATYFSLGNFLSGNPYSHTDIVIDLSAGTVTVTGALSHLDFFQIPGDTPPEEPGDPTPASATLGGTKIVSVSGEGTAPAESFTFVLTTADGTLVDTATCTGAGSFTFDALTYTQAGTYTYTITEQAGSAANWTYDNASYTATVTVSDVEGTLTADVVYAQSGESVAAAAFTNTYTVLDVPVDPPVIPPDTPILPPDTPILPPDTPILPPDTPEDPVDEIKEPNVPMGELPEEPADEIEEPDVPMGELPEEIDDPDVPLGEAPKTGDWSGLYLALSGLSGLSLAGPSFLGKKRDEE